MTMACRGMGPECTVVGADGSREGMWTAWVSVAVMGVSALRGNGGAPCTVRRMWWQNAWSVEV